MPLGELSGSFIRRRIMSISLDPAQFQEIWPSAQAYFSQHVLSWAMVAQIVVIGCALLLAYKISGGMRAWLRRQEEQYAALPEAGADLVILLDVGITFISLHPFHQRRLEGPVQGFRCATVLGSGVRWQGGRTTGSPMIRPQFRGMAPRVAGSTIANRDRGSRRRRRGSRRRHRRRLRSNR